MLADAGDPYLLTTTMSFPNRELLQRFLLAVQHVIDRHDILRTAFLWHGLSHPAQVVLRSAQLNVREIELDSADGPVAEQLAERFDPRRECLDLGKAPLLDFIVAHDADGDRWVVIQRLHHLIGDHSTLDVLRDEVHAILRGRTGDLAMPVPFRDLVAYARLGEPDESHEAYFSRILGDVHEPTLAFDLADVQQQGGGIEEFRQALPASLNNALRHAARRLGVSVASLCHLAWAHILSNTSHRDDVVFGTVLFGRSLGGEGIDRAVGLFINTLPFRLDVGKRDLASAARDTHDRLTQLIEHEHASLALAQRCSGVVAPMPLFNSVLNYRHNEAPIELNDGHISNATHPMAGVKVLSDEVRNNYPLTMSVEDFGDSLALTALVSSSLSGQHICSYMQCALEKLAEAIEGGDRVVSPYRLDIVPATERALIAAWNTTARVFPTACLGELFEQQVRRTPAAIAIQADGVALSYAALNAQANRLAHRLVRLGVGPDRRVAICTGRSVAMAVAMLAVLKAGGAYVPLDPVYSSDRLGRILGDAAASVLLLDADGRHALGGVVATQTHVLALDELPNAWADEPESDLHIDGLTPDHLAYVIYTSGSTGEPKGVMVEHRSVVNFWAAIRGPIYPDDDTALRVAWNASFSFDMSIKAFSQLLSGHTVVLLPQAVRVSAPALLAFLRDERIDAFDTTPSQLRGLLAEGLLTLSDRPRRVLLGGEPIDAAMWSQLATAPWLQAYNMYGPTECTVDVTITAIRDPHGPVHIGRPLANMRVHLRDAQGRDVPLGVAGEIYVAGIGMARGYFDRPALTAERFIADPLDAAGRLYRTGDRGRYLPDGRIQYLGRHDDQVKVRGFRIELGEIEARLSEHGAVHEATVLAQADAQGDTRLIAYVIPASAQTVSAASLRDHLAARLPEYMVPSAFVSVERWPLTRNGKLDRRALPAPDERAFANRDYEPPRGAVETAIASLWSELLGVERIGRNDHFFELGGHSLSVVQLMVKVRKRFAIELAMRDMFANPTLRAFAILVGTRIVKPATTNIVPIRTAGSAPPIFLVHPGGGGIDYVRLLAPWIRVDVPVYGIEADGMLPWQTGYASVEEMAASYVAGIKQVAPSGPYRIAGWSAGGVIAYDMARQLSDGGDEVGFLGLIDTTFPSADTTARPPFDPRSEVITLLSRLVDSKRLAEIVAHTDAMSFPELVAYVYTQQDIRLADGSALPVFDEETLRSLLQARHAIVDAVSEYAPAPTTEKIHFFEAVENTHPSSHAWVEHHRENIEVIAVSGNHLSMMDDPAHLAFLGASLSEGLDQSTLQRV
nr:amino acid adenylation domain-containing protein [Rhodanobacter sp. K2T2]